MAEKLYMIPVNDAFDADCECPVCLMYRTLETNAIDFTMGPSYMEDDVRIETNKSGFCEQHVKLLYKKQNRLGLALMLLSHMDRSTEELERRRGKRGQGGLFHKKEKTTTTALKAYSDQLEQSCYICDRIQATFERYLITLFYLYQHEDAFRTKFSASKGFCMKHYALLYEMAGEQFNGQLLTEFETTLNRLYYENISRVREDLQWFIDKFDYRNADKPWNNSRDALLRTIQKLNATDVE